MPGYAIASWEQGYGDFDMVPDLATLRRIPWLEATALVLCDVAWHDGSPVQPSPRQVLRAQIERAAALGLHADARLRARVLSPQGDRTRRRTRRHYRDLTPSVPYILDYHILATTYDEPFIRQIRNGMQAAGIQVETSKGEAWPGQQEINFRFADALTMADNHAIYKNGAKEIAHLNGCSITFMAKPDHTWIGNSCHIHSSLWRGERAGLRGRRGRSSGSGSPARSRAFRELAVFLAPTINSYKRYAAGSWAPTTLAWGNDNRTCGFRVVGHGKARRGRDADPRRRRQPVPRVRGGDRGRAARHRARVGAAAAARGQRVRVRCRAVPALAARRDRTRSRRARWRARAFGDQVVDHYLNYARTEQERFDRAVTCYERERYFERG